MIALAATTPAPARDPTQGGPFGPPFFVATRRFGPAIVFRSPVFQSTVLTAYGVDDYVRLRTIITTRLPSRWEAAVLRQPLGLPVMVTTKVDADLRGVPIGYSESVWAGERVQFSVDDFRDVFGAGTAQQGRTAP